MTVTSKVLVQGKRVENSDTAQYTSTNQKTIIDHVTVTNTTAGAVTLTVNVVANGGSVSASNVVADGISIGAGETYLCPELVGARLDAGDFVSMVASAANSLTLRMSGRVITA